MSGRQTMTADGAKDFMEDTTLVEAPMGTDDETEIVVTLDDESGNKEDKTAKVEAAAADDKPDKSDSADKDGEAEGTKPRTQKRIKRLGYELHKERDARKAAEQAQAEAIAVAQDLQGRLQQAQAGMVQTNSTFLNTMEERHEARLEGLQKDYVIAFNDGDAEKAASIQADMAVVGGELATIKQTKTAHDARHPKRDPQQDQQRQQQQHQQRQQQTQRQQTSDGQDQKVDVDPKALAWISSNEAWFGKTESKKDDLMTRTAYEINNELLNEGYEASKDDFYEELDVRMKEVFPDYARGKSGAGKNPSGDDMGSQDKNPAANRQTPALAPYSRQNDTGGAKRTMRLSPSEQALAKSFGLTPLEYAREKDALSTGAS